MSVASILLHVDDAASFESRMKLAIRLAVQFNAHLSALYVVWPTSFPNISGLSMAADVFESHRNALWKAAEQARKMCKEAAGDAGVELDWRAEEGVLIDKLNEYGRYCDLIILGQHDPGDRKVRSESAADHVVLESGTACLMVPYIGAAGEQIENVLVAWNGSLESARAVKNAVPFLKQARRVEVLIINPEQQKIKEDRAPGVGVREYLAKYGIDAEAHTIHNEQSDTGDVLLSYASDFSADLVVMGAYGHARWREKVLGGFTRHLLEHMTVPVLMSH
jgi:nucleotide-binding universal stress UspA family protein